jgi:hypothetical protein
VNFLETLRTGWASIISHRLRSGLTMLGILIGIAAVILTVGLGLGSQQQVGAQISALGSNLLIVSPGQHHLHYRHSRRVRLGIDLDDGGRDRLGVQGRRTRRRCGRSGEDDFALTHQWVDQLDDLGGRNQPVLAVGAGQDALQRTFHH